MASVVVSLLGTLVLLKQGYQFFFVIFNEEPNNDISQDAKESDGRPSLVSQGSMKFNPLEIKVPPKVLNAVGGHARKKQRSCYAPD